MYALEEIGGVRNASRPERAHEMSPSAVEIPILLPPVEEVTGDFAAWIAGVRCLVDSDTSRV